MFKSAYSEAMKNLQTLLFEEGKEAEYLELLSTLRVNRKQIAEDYMKFKDGEVIYGAFKPDFSDEDEFKKYYLSCSQLNCGKESTMEPAFSFYTNEKALVDYIWYQGESISVSRVLDLPNFIEDLGMFETCPNEVVPSDHFAMVAEFYIE